MLASTLGISSRAGAARQDFEAWLSLPVVADLKANGLRPQIWLDAQVRRGSGGTDTILRPGIGLVLADWVDVHVGYAWAPRFVDDPQSVRHEHRTWQQGTFRMPIDGPSSFMLRTRFEQRFRPTGDDLGLRVWALARLGYRFLGSIHGLVLQNQLFVALTDTDWGQRGGFDQNRTFGGWTGRLSSTGRVEAGYMAIVLRRDPEDRLRHIAFVQLILMF